MRGDDDAHGGRDRRAAVRPRAHPGAQQDEAGEEHVGVRDERRSQAEEPAHHAAASAPNRRARTAALDSRSNSASTRRRAASPSLARSAGSAARRASCPCDRLRVAGRHEQSADLVLDELGDPGDRARDDGQARAHRLHEHDRDALAASVPGRRARGDEGIRTAQLVRDLRPRARAGQHDVRFQPGRADLRTQRGRVGPVADQAAAHRDALVREQPARLDEVRLTLDLVQRPHAQDRQRPAPGACGRGREQARVDAGAHDVHLRGDLLAALLDDQSAVVGRDGCHERGLGHLPVEHPAVLVQIGAVRGEAERDPGQPSDDEPRHRGMVGEVAVHVGDAVGLHPAGRVGDLRQAGERTQEEVRAAPGPGEHVVPRAQVGARTAAQPEELARGDRRRQERRIAGTGDDRRGLGVHEAGALAQQGIEVDRHTAALERQELAEHERLAQLRESRGHVGHARGRAAPRGRDRRGASGRGDPERPAPAPPCAARRSCARAPASRKRRDRSRAARW